MSAQGGTLTRRGMIHLPLWPFAAVIVALVTAGIGLSVLQGPVEAPVPVREPAAAVDLRSNSGTPFHAAGRAHEVVLGAERSAITFATGLENPGAYGISQVTEASVQVGLENPGAYPGGLEAPKAEAHRPSVVNGEICGQCR